MIERLIAIHIITAWELDWRSIDSIETVASRALNKHKSANQISTQPLPLKQTAFNNIFASPAAKVYCKGRLHV